MKDLIPATWRKPAYLVFALVGVAFGATQTGFATAGAELPLGLTVAFQVYLYVGGAFGLVAAANTVKPTVTFSGTDTDVFTPEVYLEDEGDFEDAPKHAE